MSMFLGTVSFFGFFACIVMVIISAIKKNGKVKKWGIGIIASFIVFIIAVSMPSNNIATTTSDNTKQEQTKEDNKIDETKITDSDKELLNKAYSSFDESQRTQFATIEEKYKNLTDTEKEEIKVNFERLLTEKATYIAKQAEEEKKRVEEKVIADAKAKYDEWVKNQFSLWDGSHTALVKLVKENLNDPKSFEHVETTYADQGDHILVKMVYRAKNAFGGLILQNVTAKSDYKTNMINIISQND